MTESAVNRRLWVFIALLLAATIVVVAASFVVYQPIDRTISWLALPFLTVSLAAATFSRVRFRRGENNEILTLSESVLAPLIVFYPTAPVVAAAALAQVLLWPIRRIGPTKTVFNLAQGMLGAAVASAIVSAVGITRPISRHEVLAIVGALAAVAVFNTVAMVVVLSIAEEKSLRQGFRDITPLLGSAWLSWGMNVLFGLLFVLAMAGNPAAVLLIPVPLVLMHLAYRGFAAAQADGRRLRGLREAATALSEPLHPLDAIDTYLVEVRKCFESVEAVLTMKRDDGGYETYWSSALPIPPGIETPPNHRPARTFEVLVASLDKPARIRASDSGSLGASLSEAGWRECTSAPLVDEGERIGTLVVFDPSGFEGTTSAELAVLEALARETAHTLVRGRLLADVMEQRRRLGQIVSSASDGIFTLAEDGRILTWNEACAAITGYPTGRMLGRRDVMSLLKARSASGRPVDFGNWVAARVLPREVIITSADGRQRRLSCSATTASDTDGTRSLVVIARDITPADEFQELKEQFDHLVEMQAAQRLVVDHLQKAVAPEPPGIEGADIAVAYVASDPTSPTGGDLFDWQELPSGDLHIAVVDVLGHGVTATKDALTVVHTLRYVAREGTPLQDMVGRADMLLSAQDNDLVATVMVARFTPDTGRLQIVSGGHPSALVVRPDGGVEQVAATGGAIGWPAVGSDNVATVDLQVNDSCVIYTDGLIEARKDIIEGMEDLVRTAGEVAHLPAQQFADELVRRTLQGADRRDDTLALVLRRTPVEARDPHRRWRIDLADREGLRRVRGELRAWLGSHQVEQEDTVLVAAELLANASSVARSAVTFNATVATGKVVLEVEDDGPGDPTIDEAGRRLPDSESERGRGMYLVRALSSDVAAFSTAEGTVVRATVTILGTTVASRRVHDVSRDRY